MIDSALALLQSKLAVLPARRDGDRKGPALPSWKEYQKRLPTEHELRQWFARPVSAICIVAGAVSGNVECIDFDRGGEKFPAWRDDIPPELLAKLVVQRTPSGGVHVIYRCQHRVCGSKKLASVSGEDGRPETAIETRGEGGVFLCAPSPGYEVVQGQLTQLPVLTEDERDTLLSTASMLNEVETQPRPTPMPSVAGNRPGDDFNQRGDIRPVLSDAGWVYVATRGRNELWRRPGKLDGHSATFDGNTFFNHSSNSPGFDIGPYSPFAVYAILKHGADFSAAAREIAHQGFGERRVEIVEDDDEHEDDIDEPGAFPGELLNVPGFIGDVMKFNLETAFRPQPILALAGAICLQATLAARKVADELGNRTSIYIVGVAESGAGKEHARRINKEILYEAGLDAHLGNEELASDAGLVAAVHAQPAVLFQIDEFGRFLRACVDSKNAPHLHAIMSSLLKLFTATNTVWKGKAYAEPERNKVIDYPCVVLHGTTVPGNFFESMSGESTEDGSLARMMILTAPDRSTRQRGSCSRPPKHIIDRARWWATFNVDAVRAGTTPQPHIVPITAEAMSAFDRLADIAENPPGPAQFRSVWARALEKASRLALIYACSENAEQPLVTADAATWGCRLSRFCTLSMIREMSRWGAESPFDARQKRIRRLLEQAGGQMSKTAIYRKTQSLTQRERAEVLDNMIETGQLEVINALTNTRAKTIYRLRNRGLLAQRK